MSFANLLDQLPSVASPLLRRFAALIEPNDNAKFERMAQETGGRLFEVSKKQTVGQIYTQIAEELRAQYRLGYTPDQATAADGFHQIDLTTSQTQCCGEVGIAKEFREALDPPGERRDSLNPELVVDLRVTWIVQPCHHPRHPEDLAGQPCEHHIGVIAPRDGSQAVHTFDTGLEEHVTVQAGPKHCLPRKMRAKALECRCLLVYHDHHMATLTEALG